MRVLIYRKRMLNLRFKRIIEFQNMGVSVRDDISGPDGERVLDLQWAEVFTTIHMGSSRYFIANELNRSCVKDGDVTSRTINPQQIAEGVHLQRVVTFS